MNPDEDSGRLIVRQLGLLDYEPVWRAMQYFTNERDGDTPDEIWMLSHPPVFTQGQAGKAEHILAPGDIPVIQIDRGGQVTYHGPGQLVVYLLIDIRRAGKGIRELVSLLEQTVIDTLSCVKIDAGLRPGAPGVYVRETRTRTTLVHETQAHEGEAGEARAEEAKIASLGLRIRRGCSYHGLSLNVAMDLEPFARINPCGYQGMAVTQVADLLPDEDPATLMQTIEKLLLQNLLLQLGPYSWLDVRQEL